MYTIAVDVRRRLIEVGISGFWTAEVFQHYAQDLQAAIATMPPSDQGHLTLADVSGAVIQPQQIVEAFQTFINRGARRSRKIALYTPTALPRLQSKRISGGTPFVQVFETKEAAERWLFASDTQVAA